MIPSKSKNPNGLHTMNQSYVISHPEQGIYLGKCMGLGFWSELDAAGQDTAATFESIDQAREHISSWDMNNDPDQYMFVQVTTSLPLYATVSECEKAGLPAWSPDSNTKPILVTTDGHGEDVFHKQFEVIFDGCSSYPEDDPIYGYYTMDDTVSGGNADLISEAVALAERIVREKNYEFHDPDTDYWDEDLAQYSGPVDINADHVRIIDRNNRLVIGGVVRGDSVEWIEPVYDKAHCEHIKERQESIHAEASVEAGWDNYGTAKSLRRSAGILALSMPHPMYRHQEEILNLRTTDITNMVASDDWVIATTERETVSEISGEPTTPHKRKGPR